LIYTDGITEAANDSNEQFGDERLQNWLYSKGGSALGAEPLKIDLLQTVKNFMGESAPRDDMTFIVAAQQDV
jgi:serine phosphatase RsbU (regulator of sigma subunit)